MGSPPLTRGLRKGRTDRQSRRGITPAHAGTTAAPSVFLRMIQDHPRSRGDYSGWTQGYTSTPGSPPLTRGLLKLSALIGAIGGITPAHAGTTVLPI